MWSTFGPSSTRNAWIFGAWGDCRTPSPRENAECVPQPVSDEDPAAEIQIGRVVAIVEPAQAELVAEQDRQAERQPKDAEYEPGPSVKHREVLPPVSYRAGIAFHTRGRSATAIKQSLRPIA